MTEQDNKKDEFEIGDILIYINKDGFSNKIIPQKYLGPYILLAKEYWSKEEIFGYYWAKVFHCPSKTINWFGNGVFKKYE